MSTEPEDTARVAQLDHEELVRREHALAHAITEGWVAALRDLRPDLTRPQARRLVTQARATPHGGDRLSLHGLDLWQFLDVHLPSGVGRPPGPGKTSLLEAEYRESLCKATKAWRLAGKAGPPSRDYLRRRMNVSLRTLDQYRHDWGKDCAET